MRHRKHGYKLGRTSSHRRAMLRNMAASLFEHGQITTTLPKAKALQPFVEKIVTKAKRGDEHARRGVVSMLGGERNAFAWSYLPKNATDQEKKHVGKLRERAEAFFEIPPAEKVERNRYGELRRAPKLVSHIFDHVAPRFQDRPGGYTRIIKLGHHRLGDAAELVVVQFVGAEEGPEIGGQPSRRRRIADRRTAYAAKVRRARDEAAAPTVGTAEDMAEDQPAAEVPPADAEGNPADEQTGQGDKKD